MSLRDVLHLIVDKLAFQNESERDDVKSMVDEATPGTAPPAPAPAPVPASTTPVPTPTPVPVTQPTPAPTGGGAN
jgi:hypothetical protein